MAEKPLNPWRTFLQTLRRGLQELYPGIGRYDRVVYARVVAVDQSSGQVSNVQKLWTCDLQILTPRMEPDPRLAIVKAVPLDPVEVSDVGQALFPKAFEGMVVRLGWMYADRSLPYIVSFTAEGLEVPGGSEGRLTDLLREAITLLQKPRVTAAGAGPHSAGDIVDIELLKARIP